MSLLPTVRLPFPDYIKKEMSISIAYALRVLECRVLLVLLLLHKLTVTIKLVLVVVDATFKRGHKEAVVEEEAEPETGDLTRSENTVFPSLVSALETTTVTPKYPL